MMAIALGVSLLILSMAVVMGAPLIYYLKRDQAYEATKGQPEETQLKAWYGH